MSYRVGVLVLFLLLTACGDEALYAQLSEREANEMVAVLHNAGLPARKRTQDDEIFMVTTSQDYFAQAVEVLRSNGYPREQFESLGEVFKREGFVSSPLEERARLIHALTQEIAETINSIDGVITARVHLAVPERDPLGDKPKPSSASVFIKHRKGIDLSGSLSQIKALVVNGVEGLPYDNVTIALFESENLLSQTLQSVNEEDLARPGSFTLKLDSQKFIIGGVIIGLSLLGFGLILWFKRKRIALPPAVDQDQL